MATNDNNSSLEVIDISSSEPSPSRGEKNNTSSSGDNNSTVRIKQDPGAKKIKIANSQEDEEEDDSDIEILTPSRFPKRPNSSGSNNINNNNNGCSSNMGMGGGGVDDDDDDDDDDIQVTSSNTINPNIDHPHARFHCGVHPFTLPPNVVFDNNNNNTLSSNVNYCEKCYCFICDKLGKCVWGRTIRGLICGNDKTLVVKTRLCLFICLFYVSIRIIKSHTNTFTHCPFLYIPLI